MADIETIDVSADGTPIATVKVIDKETGTETPVHIATCTDAVTCSQGIPMSQHLENLYAHAEDEEVHLSAGEKAGLETQEGAQKKVATAKDEAITAASLMVENAKVVAADDATAKANAARNAAYGYADIISLNLDMHKGDVSNPHRVTAAQVGLGNVVNKAPNDLQLTYTMASALTALTSGEKLSVAFGKIAKAITDFIAHIANKSNPHNVTAKQLIQKKTYTETTNANGNTNTSIDDSKYIILSISAKDETGDETYLCNLYRSTSAGGRWYVNVTDVSSKAVAANKTFTFTIYYAAV